MNRSWTRVLGAWALLGSFLFSQEVGVVDYGKPRTYFPNPVGPYIGRGVPAPSLANSTRLNDLIKEGKLMLSLDDAIALALENNLDLAISRYNLQIADTDILRTKAGASARGVASGLVQGTPGGGVGGFGSGAPGAGAGGTSGGAGGAGSGASGLVQSTIGTGATVESFDPAINGNLSLEHAAFPLSNTVTTGTASLKQNTATANFAYTQAFTSGTSLSFGFNNSRQTSNSLFTSLTPLLSSAAQLQLRQRLLSGFGFGPNRRFIVIAKNNKVIADAGFRNQVIATVTQIQNIYWDLVNAFEDSRVKERSLALAQRTLEDNRKQVQLQSMAPIEVTRAEAEVEARNQELITAQSNFELQQLLMKNAISRTLDESTIAELPVVPTDTMSLPENEPVRPVQDLIGEAVDKRPEMHQAVVDLKNREVTKKAARNALLPTLDLVGFYGGSGIAGVQNPAALAAGDPVIPTTGFNDVLNRTFNNSSPDYSVGLNLNIPLRNRTAQADQVRSELEYRQAQLHIQQLKNQIVIEVRNALFSVKQNRARVLAAQKARDLAQKTFEIEQKKLALGASTSALVLTAGRDLAVAESNLVGASTIYEKSRVELDRSVGATLERLNIDLRDAEIGELHQMPKAQDVLQAKPQ
jgi:outer membrane protein TolC